MYAMRTQGHQVENNMSGFTKLIDKKIKALQRINNRSAQIAVEIMIENEHIILDMNTDDQLFLQGITADNVPIINSEPYAPFTIAVKRQKGQPVNRVTLRDSKDFHDSFKLKKDSNKVTITATDEKTFELTLRYGDSIFGLTNVNRLEIRNAYVFPEMMTLIRKAT